MLHYYVGLSLDEAALALGVPAGTVRSRLHTALGAMRRSIGVSGEKPSSVVSPGAR